MRALPFTSVLLAASCGSRTELLPGEEPCAMAGQVRPCADACGDGEQRCSDGSWQRCEVPVASRRCTNECGGGVQSCEDGAWRACVVPIAERACEGPCGTGTERCEDGSWLRCEVPPTTRACRDICGGGEQTCRDGRWETCRVEPVAVACESPCGSGETICERGAWVPCNAPQPKPPTLISVVRDFYEAHPDFELPLLGNHDDRGLVRFELGPDDNKPVYTGKPGSTTTSGAANFDQWYRDVPGVNLSTSIDLDLSPSREAPGFFTFQDDAFFPIDDQLLGNEGRSHNFHFTLETSTRFEYRGGEVFSFSGDDDMWVFINRRLAIDLGGIHQSESATVSLDAQASVLGLERGKVYPLHFFFAERHTVESHFRIHTSISEPGSCD